MGLTNFKELSSIQKYKALIIIAHQMSRSYKWVETEVYNGNISIDEKFEFMLYDTWIQVRKKHQNNKSSTFQDLF